MISTFKENHPIAWRAGFIGVPFFGGVVCYLAISTFAPTYPQSIRNYIDANLKPLRDLPLVTKLLGPNPSTIAESPMDTLMKHYASLKTEPDPVEIVRDPIPQQALIEEIEEEPQRERVTWNNTNAANLDPPQTLDMGSEPDGPLYQLAESPEADTRIRAIEALGESSGRQAVRACIDGLVDADPRVRRHASRALMRASHESLYREWIHILQHGPVVLLQTLDAEIPQLQAQLESSALAGLASGESLRLDKLCAIYTLGRIRSDAALPLLAGYAWSNDLEISQTAAAAIAEVRSPKAMGALVDLTQHYDVDVRWYATNGLGLLQGEDALATLESVIENGMEPVQEIRALAVNHLGEAGDPGSIPTLVDAISRYPGLRHDAMYALAQITGIQDFTAPFQWREWYKDWSTTPQAQAAARRRRVTPATQVAVMPEKSPQSLPTESSADVTPSTPPPTPVGQPGPRPAAAEIPPRAELPTVQEPSEPTPKKPLQVKRTGNKGSFGTSDLTPAELMRRGGFNPAKP